MSRRWLWFIPLIVIVVVPAALWLARARLAGEFAQNYFRQQGIAASISFDRLTLAGLSGRIALGAAAAPDFSVGRVEVDFDPLRWTPRIVAVRLLDPVVRATVGEDGSLRLPGLQTWLDKLSAQSGHSDYVSDDLAVSLIHLTAFLSTPAGQLALNGDAALRHNALVSAALTIQPASLSWRGANVKLQAGAVNLKGLPKAYAADITLKGDFSGNGESLKDAALHLSVPEIQITGGQFRAPHLSLNLAAASSSGMLASAHPALDLTADDLELRGDGGRLHFQLHAAADFAPPSLLALYPILARDPRIARALDGNLKHLDLALDGDAERGKDGLSFSIRKPFDIIGANQGRLHFSTFKLSGPPSALSGTLAADLSGPGLPPLHLASHSFRFAGGALSGDAALSSRFDFAMLHQASFAANGRFSYAKDAFTYALNACTSVTLAAFHPGDSDMARDIKASLCPSAANLFTFDAKGWRLTGTVKDAAMMSPLGNALLDGGAGTMEFSGQGADVSGKVTVTAAKLTDITLPARFAPLTGTGDIALKNWIWTGGFAVGDVRRDPIGTVSFQHILANGEGGMTISAPAMFAADKLQPKALSALLGKLTKAQGAVDFEGEVNWTPKGFDSKGTLRVAQLDFLTPVGTAHALDATLQFTSLLPPVTAPHQHIAISKLDWALPINAIALDFSFGNGKLEIDGASAGIAEGNARLGGITLDFSKPGTVSGAASLNGLSLAPMVNAFNLSDTVKLEGKVTGNVPFSYGDNGIRIQGGHLEAVGTGRVAIDPALWSQGGTVPVDAIHNLAYQALADLAFDKLTADINSVEDGRLQVVLHVTGHSDPAKPQQAQIAIADVINGTALQKNIDLPSGTPIDLTLDTSLNFDELLKSYAEAWSNALSATPEPQ